MEAVGGDPRTDAEIETIASGDGALPTVATGPAGAPAGVDGLAEVSPAAYQLEGEFARGGMGRILLARDRRLGRTVALKELHTGAGPGAPGRFVREALVTARLQHPAVVPVYEAGRWPDGRPFYAMKLVEGRSLEALLRDAPDLAGRLALLPHLTAVAEAVAYAHSQRVIHRDLKPANVLVGPFGETVVVDWGLARELGTAGVVEHEESGPVSPTASGEGQTVTGTVLGTPHYMPPEQARGLAVDERADVYALGAMLYFLLTGAPPHSGRTAGEALEAAATGSVEPVERREPEAPPDLVAIVRKAMAPAPAERYPTAMELAGDLRRFQTGQLVSAYRYSTRDLVRRFLRKHRTAVAVASVLTAALVLAVAIGFLAVRRQARVAEAERDRARRAAEKAERTSAFVVEMLGSADPRVAGRDVTVASVLDAASSRVEEELGGQPDVKASVLTTLGTTYQGLGLMASARQRLQAALDATAVAYGKESVEAVRALDRLAVAAEDEGDLAEAERLERQALALLQRLGETDGAEAAQVKGDLARTLRLLGRLDEAEALYRETLALQRRLGGDHRAEVATTLNNLGVLLTQRGDLAGAEPLHREALELVRAVHGREHPEVAAALTTLGGVVESKGDLAGAEQLYREGLDMRLRLLGADHPDTTRSRYALASLLRAKGDAEGALRECRQVLALRGRVLPDTHPMVAAVQQVAGLALLDLGRPREAEPLLRESLDLRRRALPPGHWLIASSESVLGACLTAERRYPEAEALLLDAHAGLEASRGRDHERTVETRQRLVDLYEAWGRPGRAAPWRGGTR
jgi:serine/threonine protein kinase/tetratricopeptide (TPR) repeat protein